VEVDVDKIKDVVLNLIDNAIKYSPKGSVAVSAESDGKVVHVMVKDSGVGIAPEEARNLFSKFVRGSGIARVEPNGSGLGLFIAKKITEEHGGRIWVESEGEGKGSTFQFEIPVKADKAALKKVAEMKARVRKSTK
jgi:signal transduction histidine kinase